MTDREQGKKKGEPSGGRTQIIVAIIGAVAVVVAGLIAGFFQLESSHTSASSVSPLNTPPISPSAPIPTTPSEFPTAPAPTSSVPAGLIPLHSPGVDAVAYSFDGNFLATGNRDGVVGVWQTGTWKALPSMNDADGKDVTSVAFNPLNNLLAAGDAGGNVYLWSHYLVQTLNGPSGAAVRSVAFSFNQSGIEYLAIGYTNGVIGIWEDGSAGPLGTWSQAATVTAQLGESVNSVAFNPSNPQQLATGDTNGKVYLWAWADDHADVLGDPSGRAVESVVFSTDSTAVVGGDSGGHVYVWQVSSGQRTESLTDQGSKGITSVAFNSGTTTIAAADGNGLIYLWLYTLKGVLRDKSRAKALSVAFSPSPGSSELAVASSSGNVYVMPTTP